MSQIINNEGSMVQKYYFKCFNCGAGFIYKKNEVHHNAALNRVVGKHGFSGYDGEVHCPGCGTWLPHYEQNIYRGPDNAVTDIRANMYTSQPAPDPMHTAAPQPAAVYQSPATPQPVSSSDPGQTAVTQATAVYQSPAAPQPLSAPQLTAASQNVMPDRAPQPIVGADNNIQSERNFCIQCGARLETGAVFCGNCGIKL